jgi:hypothetical protein
MTISQTQFREYVGRFLQAVAPITSLEDLDRKLGSVQPAAPGEHVEFAKVPSNHGTLAYTVSYVVPGTGVPVEFKINPQMGSATIILKMESQRQGYNPFVIDPYQNIVQMKEFAPATLGIVKKELESLIVVPQNN